MPNKFFESAERGSATSPRPVRSRGRQLADFYTEEENHVF